MKKRYVVSVIVPTTMSISVSDAVDRKQAQEIAYNMYQDFDEQTRQRHFNRQFNPECIKTNSHVEVKEYS